MQRPLVEALFSLIESWAEGGPCGLRVLDDRFQCRLSYISESNGLLEE